jgi:hypothetical protein
MSHGDDAVPAAVTAGGGAASRIAGYRLEQRIGAGGMAVVYRARDERLGRLVALKILAPGLAADEEFRQRFVRESRAAAAVDHPHIIPVFEASEADGVLFIAMRYVAGGDVRGLMRREGRLAPARVMAIISPVASALDAAHAAGLVHRDVKPANMLMDTSPGRPDHVYLADFGLSKGYLAAGTLTMTGHSLGTPAYMAPEQLEGQTVDGRADQFALACAAFELLTGEPPFERDQEKSASYAQLYVTPPALTSRRADLPPSADGVFAKALGKSPDNRYASCRDFAEALRRAFALDSYGQDHHLSGEGHLPTEIAFPSPGSGTADRLPADAVGSVPGDARAADGRTVTSLPRPGGSGVGAGHGLSPAPGPPRRRRVPVLITGIAAVIAVVIVATVVLAGGGSHPKLAVLPAANIGIAADSSYQPVGGYTYVGFMAGQDSTARIHGTITRAVSGEVAQLYAQPFPFKASPAQVDAVILHATGKTAQYSFRVTPSVATRYTVKLFQSSTAHRASATSPAQTVYVSATYTSSGKNATTCNVVCHDTYTVKWFVPASALSIEITKKTYVYFGVTLTKQPKPPDPKTLSLGAGSSRAGPFSFISDTEFDQTINFSYRINDDYAQTDWQVCFKDTETVDGVGLPGHHGCGDQSTPDLESGYLG